MVGRALLGREHSKSFDHLDEANRERQREAVLACAASEARAPGCHLALHRLAVAGRGEVDAQADVLLGVPTPQAVLALVAGHASSRLGSSWP